MKGQVRIWFEFASEDLKMAELAFTEKIYNQVCFHSQQCIEKVLKGLMIYNNRMHPQSHKLADLLSALPRAPVDDLRDDILLIDRFYIPTRYPDALPGTLPEGLPTVKDAEESLSIARKVFERVKEEIEKA